MAVHEDLITAVQQQLTSRDTPFVADTHQRLISEETIDANEATEMIAHCLADELDAMSEGQRDFDISRYQLLLSLLPTLPEG